MKSNIKCYTCEGDCDISEEQLKICEDGSFGCWKSSIIDPDGTRRYNRGCISNQFHRMALCRKRSVRPINATATNLPVTASYNLTCCRGELCNGGPFPYLPGSNPITDFFEEWQLNSLNSFIALAGSSIILMLVVIWCTFRGIRKHRRKRRPSKLEKDEMDQSNPELNPPAPSISQSMSTSKDGLQELRTTQIQDIQSVYAGLSITSGSGAGKTLLTQRTLGKQVYLADCLSKTSIKKGSFGRQIWRGVRLGENVAVKVYYSRDEATWSNEVDIYSHLCINRHEYILGYIGTDIISRAGDTQLWLVTDYCSLGSLYQYLNTQSRIDYNQMFNICLSIVRGLIYLHQEIRGCSGAEVTSFNVKPSVAHCNLRSKNILMKNGNTCFISDFSCAVTQNKLTDEKLMNDKASFYEKASKLYMAPELLEEKFDSTRLEDYCNADVYSLGLVIWEMCRKCSSKDTTLNYVSPYSDVLGNNLEPTVEEMRKLLLTDQCRPDIPVEWDVEPALSAMKNIMQECWYTKPAARLPPLRIKKALMKNASNYPDVHLLTN